MKKNGSETHTFYSQIKIPLWKTSYLGMQCVKFVFYACFVAQISFCCVNDYKRRLGCQK